jgi:hypothetical protein
MRRARAFFIVWLVLLFAVWLLWFAMTGGSSQSLEILGWAEIWVVVCGLVTALGGLFASWRALPPPPPEEAAPDAQEVRKKARRDPALPTKRLAREPGRRHSGEPAAVATAWKHRCSACQQPVHRYARICPFCRARLR